ncbi:hypothetical protein BAUCODRAFT_341952 [Baudoinia panamericana UAMH 10762]|uniref:Uncharacterized protein n=1 Tax=Baudoinia panamericana (strain UAMH 10762) TaxID=717646 RepID=M2N693_BAUPA|nr:uncharacterized protein BAUCODRAFT_341952 [Baudoinia panamericana UAMH 10762]EMC99573.1 hypothetical protein BAUCODRAFT_341952 [Baudoinia panamericana UAMH 10762]
MARHSTVRPENLLCEADGRSAGREGHIAQLARVPSQKGADTVASINGKLKRPSNPRYRNPVLARQRPLGDKHQARPEIYDFADSLEERLPLPRRQLEGATISPTKPQKRAIAQAVNARILSADQRAVDAQLNGYYDAADAGDQGALDEAESIEEDHYRDCFPDRTHHTADHGDEQQALDTLEAQIAVAISAEEDGSVEAENARDGPSTATRKRGRPRKDTTALRPSDANIAIGDSSSKAETRASERQPVESPVTRSKTEASKRVTRQTKKRQSSTRATRIAEETRADRERAGAAKEQKKKQAQNVRVTKDQAELAEMNREAPEGVDARNDAYATSNDGADAHETHPDELSAKAPSAGDVPRLAQVRGSQLFPGASANPFSDSPEKQQEASRKRKAGLGGAQPSANFSRKRQRVHDRFDAGEVEEDQTQTQHANRLFGQWRTLQKVYRAVDNIGIHYTDGEPTSRRKFKVEDNEVKEVLTACEAVLETVASGEEPARDLTELAQLVDALYRPSDESEPDFASRLRAKDIYAHVFGKMVEVLKQLILRYRDMDEDSLSIGHLTIVARFVKVIIELGTGAKLYTHRPEGLAIIAPCERGIVIPLRDEVYPAFARVLRDHHRAENHRLHQQRHAEERALDIQREVQEQRQRDYIRRVQARWSRLHTERRWAECKGPIPPEKFERLRTPRLQPEEDSNGESFERLQVFMPRVGPPPALVEQAKALVWSEQELGALSEGLRRFRNDEKSCKFTKIIRAHCGREGVLNRYTVTEIVTMAAQLRDYLVEERMRLQGEVDEWILQIPVWTKGHPLGKENLQVGDDTYEAHDQHVDGEDDGLFVES